MKEIYHFQNETFFLTFKEFLLNDSSPKMAWEWQEQTQKAAEKKLFFINRDIAEFFGWIMDLSEGNGAFLQGVLKGNFVPQISKIFKKNGSVSR